MTLLDIAQAARGKLRDGYSAPQAGGTAMVADMAYGTATADSSNGFVTIVMDNMPAGATQSDYEFTVACDAPITNGDRVALVTINGTEKAISMGTLSEQVADVVNYFWADSAGVHVSTEEGDPDGAQNIVLDSSGLTIREGSDDVANFAGNTIQLGMNAEPPTPTQPSTAAIEMLNLFAMTAEWMEFRNPDGASGFGGIGLDIDAQVLQAMSLRVLRSAVISGDISASGYYNSEKIKATGIFPYQLYSDSTGAGQNSTITLSESAASFVWLEFIYTDGTRQYCERLYSPNGKSTSLDRSVVSGSTIYHASLMVSVSGTTVTVGAGAQATISSGASVSTTCPLKIVEVKGGK